MITAAVPKVQFRDLPRPRQRLLRLMQDVNFGRITFSVRHGEPDVARPWRTRRTVKLASGENGPRPEVAVADFELSREQTALLDALSRVRDSACVTVEVRHGLPFLVEIDQDHMAA